MSRSPLVSVGKVIVEIGQNRAYLQQIGGARRQIHTGRLENGQISVRTSVRHACFGCLKASKVLNICVCVVANLYMCESACVRVRARARICAAASLRSQNKEWLQQRDGSLLLTDELVSATAIND